MAPPSKDQETDWEPIINAVQPHEFLYNPQLPDYMDRDKKKRTWAEIGKALVPECDGDAAYVQWKRIKDQYDKKKREAAKKKSGSAADDYLKKWAWSAHMSFLDKVRIVAQPQTSLAQQQPQASGSATVLKRDADVPTENDEEEEESLEIDEERDFHVEKILKKRVVCGQRQLLIKWVDDDEPTWEPYANADGCPDLLGDFEREDDAGFEEDEGEFDPEDSGGSMNDEGHFDSD